MAEVSVAAASEIYACNVAVGVEHRRVRHLQFRDFCFRIRHLLKALGETGADEYWRPIVSTLKRYRFEASVAPVGFGNKCLMPPETIYKIELQLERCRRLFQPELAAEGTILLETLKGLVAADDNPLLNELTDLAATKPLTIALKEPRHVPVLEEVLVNRGLSDVMKVVSEAQLRGGKCYEKIACIGARSWYEDYIFRAPRAPRLIVVRFEWIHDARPRGHIFDGWERVRTTLNIQRRHEDKADDVTMRAVDISDELIESEELMPRLDLANISRQYARPGSTDDEAMDDVVAKLFQLEGAHGVFLEADERATALVIDLEEDERRRVKRARTAHITPGMFLLLREGGGGGDYLVPIADKVLGERAAGLRKFQKRWKESLRSVVRQFGLPEIVRKLRTFGAVRANEVNVRNWMSERNIRTEDPRDFRAIMTLIGLSKESEHCWQFASEIARAHQRAGAVVRKLLLKQVLRSDLTELETAGMMRFELSEVGGNPLAALRVLRISPEVVRISASHTGKLIDLENAGWHA
jgi:hypothetical protein